MDKKISQLIELLKASITDTDMFAIVNAGETKKISIATLFNKIDDVITAALDAFKSGFGVKVLIAAAPILNTIETTFTKIKLVNSLALDKSNTHISHDFDNDNVTVNCNGIYELSILGSFTAPQNSIITFTRYKNGGILGGGAQVEFIGKGATPIQIVGTITVELLTDDVMDIRAKSDSANTDITIQSAQYKIEKTHF